MVYKKCTSNYYTFDVQYTKLIRKFMQDLTSITDQVCSHFSLDPSKVIKAKYGKTPEFRVIDIITRLLYGATESINSNFKEIASRSTIVRMLQKCFPGKTLTAQHWSTYILSAIGMKKCNKCTYIISNTSFYTDMRCGFSSICIECEKQRNSVYYINNKASINTRNKKYNIDNNEETCAQKREYYLSHKAETVARTIKRNICKDRATPPWANLTKMNLIYANRKEGYHVDHIIPLQGINVSGLHWEHNLQYLPAAENIAKSNNFDSNSYIHILP